MGHRALVAYRRPDYLYDVRYSHWGGDDLALADEISAETPLANGAVDADLLADSVALERLLTEYLDPRVHEALYLVPPTTWGDRSAGDADFDGPGAVTSFRVLWLELGDGRDGARGALVEVVPGPRDRALRAWFRGVKTTLADVVEMGVLSRRAARAYLESRVCEDENGRVYAYENSTDGDVDDELPDLGPRRDRDVE